MSSILFYITGHGYGHAVRSSRVIEALKQARPHLGILVRTTAPQWLFPPVAYTRRAIDVGIIQKDSLSMDLSATLSACRQLHQTVPEIIQEEIAFVRRHRIGAIVSDVPPLCFEIAKRTGIASIAIANFTWDYIYRAYVEQYPDFLPLILQMERFYSSATIALTLPYSCPMAVFPRRESIPWITRVSPLTRNQARARLGLPRSAAVVLLSFGGLGLSRLPWDQLKKLPQYRFVATGDSEAEDGNIRIIPATQKSYVDIVRGVDAVITKPGYGIVADAIAHRVPVLYTERGNFAEYARLVEGLRRCATAAFIPQSDLFAGKLAPYLEWLLDNKTDAPAVDISGAGVAAEKILSILDQ